MESWQNIEFAVITAFSCIECFIKSLRLIETELRQSYRKFILIHSLRWECEVLCCTHSLKSIQRFSRFRGWCINWLVDWASWLFLKFSKLLLNYSLSCEFLSSIFLLLVMWRLWSNPFQIRIAEKLKVQKVILLDHFSKL